ncbi:MAG TPA: SRPBCC family protein [Roseiflexaceae bacterium]|nr:SRPBCC family protein [Roseiflexaceae bacterium]HMP40870.1 SRPBCC family protein [Roseiflexaceae bacterium]
MPSSEMHSALAGTASRAGANSRAISVMCSRAIAATPEAIFAVLSDAKNLTHLLPNVRRVELLEQHVTEARIRTHMSIGPVANIQSEGIVSWIENREIRFVSSQPVHVTTCWLLTAAGDTTHVQLTLDIDLTPMMGPLAVFVPQEQVRAMITPDLEQTLTRMARLVE